MDGEDGYFEVVVQLVTPCLNGLAHDVTTALSGLPWRDTCVCLTGGDGNGGMDKEEVVAMEVACLIIGGLEDLTSSCSEGGGTGDEEGTVGAELGCVSLHLCIAHVEAETLIEESDHVGCVGGASTKTCLRGDVLIEMDVDAGQLVVVGEEMVGSDDEVVALVAVDGIACDLKVAGDVGGEIIVHPLDF